jgi:uncharacterized membrane protein YcaP (DUF421 family)
VVRVSGKRTLSKLNAFDLVVTIALGSTLSSALLSRDVALAEGLTAVIVLVGLQALVSWASSRSQRFQHVIKAEPRLLVHDGRLLRHAMRHERISEAEVLAAVRQAGLLDVSDARAVVLETDGSLSVMSGQGAPAERSALQSVSGAASP